MKRFLFAVVLGCAVGFLGSAAVASGQRAPGAGAGGVTCGTKVCAPNQECCVSPGPVTHTCVQPGHCRWN